MQLLTMSELGEVSGGGVGKVAVSAGVTIGSAQIGGAVAAARIGTILGAPAGPFGMIVGGMIGAGCSYAYFRFIDRAD